MTTKILYFTAGPVPTTEENADVAALNMLAETKYSVGVRNRLASQSFGSGAEACDMVAGTPPSGAPWNAKPVFTPVNATEGFAPVYDNMEVTGVAPSGTYVSKVTFAVTDGVITGIALS